MLLEVDNWSNKVQNNLTIKNLFLRSLGPTVTASDSLAISKKKFGVCQVFRLFSQISSSNDQLHCVSLTNRIWYYLHSSEFDVIRISSSANMSIWIIIGPTKKPRMRSIAKRLKQSYPSTLTFLSTDQRLKRNSDFLPVSTFNTTSPVHQHNLIILPLVLFCQFPAEKCFSWQPFFLPYCKVKFQTWLNYEWIHTMPPDQHLQISTIAHTHSTFCFFGILGMGLDKNKHLSSNYR